MKTICTGDSYRIFSDTMQTYDQLPAQTYIVRFSQNEGFSLEKYSDIEIKESKIYGVHMQKVEKVLDSYRMFNRNLGVILSGDKGIGKSLFAKLLSSEAMKTGLPVIIVDSFIPGIASFIEAIEQEVVILFDEFDKTFGESGSSGSSPQTSMLSLFDGVSAGKKLFVITCNNLYKLNEFLVNRPGRFHYHFRFDYPTAAEVRMYLEDKVPKEQYGEIENVIIFSRKVKLNYDCLRAIAFELSRGLKFKDAIADLNIVNTENMRYKITLLLKSGARLYANNVGMDLFDDDAHSISLYDQKGCYVINVNFNTVDCVYDVEKMTMVIHQENLQLDMGLPFDEEEEARAKSLGDDKPELLIFTRAEERSLHYAV